MDSEKKCNCLKRMNLAVKMILLTDEVKQELNLQDVKTNVAILDGNQLNINEDYRLSDDQFSAMKALQ